MILLMTSTQVVETSVTTTDNSPSQDYTNPDDQTTLLHIIRLFAVRDGVLVFRENRQCPHYTSRKCLPAISTK